eukprot:3329834-Rhodomonas_salina.1
MASQQCPGTSSIASDGILIPPPHRLAFRVHIESRSYTTSPPALTHTEGTALALHLTLPKPAAQRSAWTGAEFGRLRVE